jgi:phosphoglycerate dehydrogenase-like enzyme
MPAQVPVLVASYLEPAHVSRIAAVDPRVSILYDPALVPAPRYVCDHTGTPPRLTDAEQVRWEAWLGEAEVSFDFDWQSPELLPERAPRLRWVQATSAGIGALVRRTGLDGSGLVMTTAAGIHAVPLAEFAVTGALYFIKGVPHLLSRQRAHDWERYTTAQLAGRVVTVVGLGGIGRRVVATFAGLGTHVIGVGRPGRSYDVPGAAETVSDLDGVLARTDVLILCCPLTPETDGLVGRSQLDLLPAGAILVNLSRGRVVDESAMIAALRSGRLGGACLDVFEEEPLPASSPLWDMDNVLVSPHSASTVVGENAALTELFCENLRSYLDGEPLRNLYRRELGY